MSAVIVVDTKNTVRVLIRFRGTTLTKGRTEAHLPIGTIARLIALDTKARARGVLEGRALPFAMSCVFFHQWLNDTDGQRGTARLTSACDGALRGLTRSIWRRDGR